MKDYVLTTEELRHIFTWTLDKNANWQDPADFDQWLAEHERQKQAEAWEEGWCEKSLQVDGYEWHWNPYERNTNE